MTNSEKIIIEKALQNVIRLQKNPDISLLQKYFERIQRMKGANHLFKRIAFASEIEQLKDYFAEVRYILIFAGLNFQIEIEPLGNKGPDLRISRGGYKAVAEITRFRTVNQGPPSLNEFNEKSMLIQYGDFSRDIRKVFEKLLNKFSQVGVEPSIIAIWNDDGDLDNLEVEQAVTDIRRDSKSQIITLPNDLLFIIYGSEWKNMRNKQLYCFPMQHSGESFQELWQNEINFSVVKDLLKSAIS